MYASCTAIRDSHIPQYRMTETQTMDENLDRVLLVDHLPSDSWVEGVAIRPDGNVLTTCLDTPELYSINMNGDSWTTKPKLLHTFPNATGAFNVCRLPGTGDREEYAVLSGSANLETAQFHSWVLWRVCPPPDGIDEKSVITKITEPHEAVFCMGMITIGERTLLICDAGKCCIWKVDLPTGHVSVFLSDAATMSPASKDELFGINRCRVFDGYLYFTNHSAGTLCRAPIELLDDGQDIRCTGAVKVCAGGLSNAEGLVMTNDGKIAWVCSYVSGALWRIQVDDAGEGTVTKLREDLVSPTTMELHTAPDGKRTLYIVCCGAMDPNWAETQRGRWVQIASVDPAAMKIQVTVTTEITYSYEDA